MITQNIRSAADQDTASPAKTAGEETVERMDGRATDAQPKAGTPDTGVNGDSPGGNGDEDFHFQMAAERYRNVSQWAVVASTLRH
jgi:septal ring-binding cell division protein DamX